MATTIDMIEMLNKGMPPVAGGMLDQSAWFIRAARCLEHQENLIKAEANE